MSSSAAGGSSPSDSLRLGTGRQMCERAPQHEVNAQREFVELENEVLPPGKNVFHLLARKAVDPDLAVTGDGGDLPSDKGLKLFGGEME